MAEVGTEAHYRARLLIGLSVCTVFMMAAGCVVQLWLGDPTNAALLFARLLAALALFPMCRRGLSLEVAGHGLMAIIFSGNAIVLIGSGATVPIALLSPILFPIMATTLMGTRGGVIWTLLTTATLIAGLAVDVLGLPAPLKVSPERFDTFRYVGVWFMILFALVLSVMIELLKRGSMDDLAEARKRADAAAEARAAFLARMSHEIRTPLNGVLGMARLLENTTLSAEQAQLMGGMVRSGDQLLALLNDLLDLSKLEAGGLELELRPVNINQLAEDTVALMRPAATEKELMLAARSSLTAPQWRQLDSNRIQQVLLNLLSNAIKFTPAGGSVTLTVSLDGDRLLLSVSDTGPGIPAERQAGLFDPFTQADPSVARQHGGTGLGLSLSRELARRMGGELLLQSTVGIGSRFTLDVPAPPAQQPQAAAVPQLASLSGMRVLVAEDNAVNRFIVERMLEAAGCEVTTVEDGRQAVERSLQAAFDVIIVDWHMPELTGPEAAQQIRRLHPSPPPIVALTANVTPEARATCEAVGIVEFLTKPVAPSALHATLSALRSGDAQYFAASSSVSG